MDIIVYNRSTIITDDEVRLMVKACNVLMKQVCAAWNRLPVNISFITWIEPDAYYTFYVLDSDGGDPNKTSYHSEAYGKIVGYVFAKTILKNGGAILYKDNSTYTIASALFQEIAQALINPYVNTWWKMNSTTLAAGEICDPVHYNIVVITVQDDLSTNSNQCNNRQQIKKVEVGLSDFVYPAWHNPLGKTLANPKICNDKFYQYNYKKTLSAPFTTSGGGFIMTLNINTKTITKVFGKDITPQQKKLITKSIRF